MPEELAVIEKFEALAVHRAPEVVLEEARKAAKALTTVIDGKKKKVQFNGETYLENEDWLTVARFYGVTSRILSTKYIEYGDVRGFEATAEAYIVGQGEVISTAEAMCLNDEPNWSKKPLFQLRSMAQTRASSRVLRQVFGWVVVLAGYKATPAEEMDGVEGQSRQTPRGRQNAAPARKDKVVCAECRATDSHAPHCSYHPSNVAKASSTGQPAQEVIPKTEAKPETTQPAKTEEKVGKATKEGTVTVVGVQKKKSTKGTEYLELSCKDGNAEGTLFVWHKHLHEYLEKAAGVCVFDISSNTVKDKTYYSVEHIHQVGAVRFENDKPLASPSGEDLGFGPPEDDGPEPEEAF